MIRLPVLNQLLRGRTVPALAVMILFVSVGGSILPGIFADTLQSNLTNIVATPSNSAAYSIKLTWRGSTSGHWEGDYYLEGAKVGSWTSSIKGHEVSNLSCGRKYSFRIAAIGADGGLETAYKTIQASTICPHLSDFRVVAVGNALVANWKGGGLRTQMYNVYVKTGSGPYVFRAVSGNSATMAISCGNSYAAYVVPVANGQIGVASSVLTVSAPTCLSTQWH